ncbi:MAG: nucleotidyl transferase AbiEii/AbiGii toxin family protein, partial [Dechloromonas sp.]
MTRFALERYLYRLSRSPYADAFVLKGAALFVVWAGSDARPTRDVDLLARVEADLATVRRTVAAICRTEVEPDGLNFQPEAMQIEAIQALRQFGGFRVIVPVLLGRTRLQVQIDLGFGDAVTPAPQHLTYPTLLNFPAPQLAAYHMETVIAEKLEAMIKLGTLNTRTKDYYDLLI